MIKRFGARFNEDTREDPHLGFSHLGLIGRLETLQHENMELGNRIKRVEIIKQGSLYKLNEVQAESNDIIILSIISTSVGSIPRPSPLQSHRSILFLRPSQRLIG